MRTAALLILALAIASCGAPKQEPTLAQRNAKMREKTQAFNEVIEVYNRKPGEYSFLKGKTPLKPAEPTQELVRHMGFTHTIYTFKANWKELTAAADKEFREDGYRKSDDDITGQLAYVRGKLGMHTGYADSFRLWKDRTYSLATNGVYKPRKGWVVVSVFKPS